MGRPDLGLTREQEIGPVFDLKQTRETWKLKGCAYCGGDLYFDHLVYKDEYVCFLCGRPESSIITEAPRLAANREKTALLEIEQTQNRTLLQQQRVANGRRLNNERSADHPDDDYWEELLESIGTP